VSGHTGKRNHTNLAEESDESEAIQNHEESAHAKEHHASGKGENKREHSRHNKLSGHVVMNSTRSADAKKHHTKGNDSQHGTESSHVLMEAAPAAPKPCTVSLFRDGVVDCKGVSEKIITTTSSKGEEHIFPDKKWGSALVSDDCATVKFYDDDYDYSRQDVQVVGGAGCVRFAFDLEDDMNGVMETAKPTCTVSLFRDGVVDCKGVAAKVISSSKTTMVTVEKSDLPDNDWASALVSGDCKSVAFSDDDYPSSKQDVTVAGDAGCVRFEYDLEDDMNGVTMVPVPPLP